VTSAYTDVFVCCSQMMLVDSMKRSKLAKSPSDGNTTSDMTSDADSETSLSTKLRSSVPQSPPQNDADEEDDTQDEVLGDQLKPLRLELTPESQLDCTEPVCVELMDCSTSVKEVLKWLTSASWCVSLSVLPSFHRCNLWSGPLTLLERGTDPSLFDATESKIIF